MTPWFKDAVWVVHRGANTNAAVLWRVHHATDWQNFA